MDRTFRVIKNKYPLCGHHFGHYCVAYTGKSRGQKVKVMPVYSTGLSLSWLKKIANEQILPGDWNKILRRTFTF